MKIVPRPIHVMLVGRYAQIGQVNFRIHPLLVLETLQ